MSVDAAAVGDGGSPGRQLDTRVCWAAAVTATGITVLFLSRRLPTGDGKQGGPDTSSMRGILAAGPEFQRAAHRLAGRQPHPGVALMEDRARTDRCEQAGLAQSLVDKGRCVSEAYCTPAEFTGDAAPGGREAEPSTEQVEPEHPADCGTYGQGHVAHYIGIRVRGAQPWGWRDGVVTSIRGLHLQIKYLHEDGSVSCWHHQDLSDELAVGSPVRVFESALLDTGNRWISVRTEGGLGPVAEPADPELWAPEINTTITDLHAGRGIVVNAPTDHPDHHISL